MQLGAASSAVCAPLLWAVAVVLLVLRLVPQYLHRFTRLEVPPLTWLLDLLAFAGLIGYFGTLVLTACL